MAVAYNPQQASSLTYKRSATVRGAAVAGTGPGFRRDVPVSAANVTYAAIEGIPQGIV